MHVTEMGMLFDNRDDFLFYSKISKAQRVELIESLHKFCKLDI